MNFVLRLKYLWSTLQNKLAAVAVGLVSLGALVLGHKVRVRQAERKGVRKGTAQEQQRVNTETARVSQQMKEQADATHKATNDIDDSELADGLRAQRDRLSNR